MPKKCPNVCRFLHTFGLGARGLVPGGSGERVGPRRRDRAALRFAQNVFEVPERDAAETGGDAVGLGLIGGGDGLKDLDSCDDIDAAGVPGASSQGWQVRAVAIGGISGFEFECGGFVAEFEYFADARRVKHCDEFAAFGIAERVDVVRRALDLHRACFFAQGTKKASPGNDPERAKKIAPRGGY